MAVIITTPIDWKQIIVYSAKLNYLVETSLCSNTGVLDAARRLTMVQNSAVIAEIN
jgi:hypothetical protein